ncbi:hypothetical protein BU17DRAFT_66257 [Hysterangium stoloniferum]|nr:hypothetical protein BU17DRAFT_66257 [Hysterangium stoloniferum]
MEANPLSRDACTSISTGKFKEEQVRRTVNTTRIVESVKSTVKQLTADREIPRRSRRIGHPPRDNAGAAPPLDVLMCTVWAVNTRIRVVVVVVRWFEIFLVTNLAGGCIAVQTLSQYLL